jgi:ketosteroid isomerase-like protein
VIDAWHAAAARADEAAYFDLLTDDAIFLGTDSSERWTKTAFREFVHPYFSTGRGWTYTPRDRSVYFSADGRVAWFEEKLDNEKYGELRGTGVLRRTGPSWKIAHYSMSFPVPNDRTEGVVRIIRGE